MHKLDFCIYTMLWPILPYTTPTHPIYTQINNINHIYKFVYTQSSHTHTTLSHTYTHTHISSNYMYFNIYIFIYVLNNIDININLYILYYMHIQIWLLLYIQCYGQYYLSPPLPTPHTHKLWNHSYKSKYDISNYTNSIYYIYTYIATYTIVKTNKNKQKLK